MKALIFFLSLLAVSAAEYTKTLAWDASPDPDVTHYCIYTKTNYPHGEWMLLQKTETNNLSLTITNFQAGTRYVMVATAVNSSGFESDYSNPVSYGTPPLSPVSPPSNLKISLDTNQTVSLEFRTEPGKAYVMKHTQSLPATNWTEFATLYSNAEFDAKMTTGVESKQQYWLQTVEE